MLHQTHHLRACASATAWTPGTLANGLRAPKVTAQPVSTTERSAALTHVTTRGAEVATIFLDDSRIAAFGAWPACQHGAGLCVLG